VINSVSLQVYNSNAIENSTLTLEETDKILLEIDPGRYILVREHFEAVIINYLLIREGYVPITITFTDRNLNYDAFEEFESSGKSSVMELIIGKALTNSYHKRLAYLEGMEIVSLREYSRRFNTSHSNLINKAHRQTIPAFLEKGKWKIGIPAERH
jgi:hypothetical protein